MKEETVEKFLISEEDLQKYFNNKSSLSWEELKKYYMEKNVINFNAIFNATPR